MTKGSTILPEMDAVSAPEEALAQADAGIESSPLNTTEEPLPVVTDTAESPLRKVSLLTGLPQAPLMPFDATGRFEQAIPFAFDDYLELVDTVGRTLRADKRGAIPQSTPKILLRLNIDTEAFIEHASHFLKEFGHAVGRPEALVAHAAQRQSKYLRGMAAARAVCQTKAA